MLKKASRLLLRENSHFILSWVGIIPTLQDDLQNNHNGWTINSCLLLISFTFHLRVVTRVLETGLRAAATFVLSWLEVGP